MQPNALNHIFSKPFVSLSVTADLRHNIFKNKIFTQQLLSHSNKIAEWNTAFYSSIEIKIIQAEKI